MNKSTCLSCEIVAGERATCGGIIAENDYFHAHQDVAYPVPGLVIVASKRHFNALDEMTPEEITSFMPLVTRIRRAQREVLGIEHTYYFYNEDTNHHFHLWMVPRHPWMEEFGRSVQSLRPALRHARDTMSSERELGALADVSRQLRESLDRQG